MIYETDVSVELVRVQPNGPDCEPTKYAIALVATKRRALEIVAG